MITEMLMQRKKAKNCVQFMTSTFLTMSPILVLLICVSAMPTVKMETLCSRFYAVISGTSGDIDMGSSRECLKSKN